MVWGVYADTAWATCVDVAHDVCVDMALNVFTDNSLRVCTDPYGLVCADNLGFIYAHYGPCLRGLSSFRLRGQTGYAIFLDTTETETSMLKNILCI